jgi:IclR family acetate operon transcriptional repressor
MQAVDRVADILHALRPVDGKRDFSLTEITQATGLSHVTVRRILKAMEPHRWVEYMPETRRYRLGFGIVQLGYSVWSGHELRTVAHDALLAAVRRTGDTAYLAVRDGDNGVFIDRVDSDSAFRIVRPLGVPQPLSDGAAKLAILAFLPAATIADILPRLAARDPQMDRAALRHELAEIRALGYAVSLEEAIFVSGVGAPIFNAANEVVAAVSLTGPLPAGAEERLRERTLERARAVCATAATISTRLGYALDAPAAPWRPAILEDAGRRP